VKDFKDLKVWQKAHELTISIYSASSNFPREEIYGLTSQLRRSAISVGANIAEGCGRRSDGEFVRFLQIARGSASEIEYHLLLARDLKFTPERVHADLEMKLVEVQRMLTSLVSAIEDKGSRLKSKPRGRASSQQLVASRSRSVLASKRI
jgi:four helix bundle protein